MPWWWSAAMVAAGAIVPHAGVPSVDLPYAEAVVPNLPRDGSAVPDLPRTGAAIRDLPMKDPRPPTSPRAGAAILELSRTPSLTFPAPDLVSRHSSHLFYFSCDMAALDGYMQSTTELFIDALLMLEMDYKIPSLG